VPTITPFLVIKDEKESTIWSSEELHKKELETGITKAVFCLMVPKGGAVKMAGSFWELSGIKIATVEFLLLD